MESIIITHTQPEETTASYSLNTTGRPRYGTLSELLQTPSVPSTVGTPAGNVINNAIRQSKHYRSRIVFTNPPSPVVFQPLTLSQTITWPAKFDVLVYGPGDYFAEHSDFITKKSHCATLLVFPPQQNSHTGGTLTIKRPDNTDFIFESSNNAVWTFIAFKPQLRHSCSPVLSGQRIVFKTELHTDKPLITQEIQYLERDFIVDRVRF